VLLLVTTDHDHVAAFADPHLGRLVQPRSFPRVRDTAAAGIPWAADNDAFNGWSDEAAQRYTRMLDAIADLNGCRFVTVPDVVADAEATARYFERWAPAVARRGLPVALVLQDGIDTPAMSRWLLRTWPRLDAVFIGGSTDFKMGDVARALVLEAKARGKWVHMGRVNTLRRVRYAASIGCDSIDGTSYVRWRRRRLGEGLDRVKPPVQLHLGHA
jgi:hypothetical protein